MNALRIAGYARISFTEDQGTNASIENQKMIISKYAKDNFGDDDIHMYTDMNFSGYNFDRPDFNKLKKDIEEDKIDIVIAKDLSRIGRHNAKTLLFLEHVEMLGKRIIAINDSFDTNDADANTITGVKTWYNELFIKDTSKKIKNVIASQQQNAQWICAVPFGYRMVDYQKRDFVVDDEAAIIIRRIFKMYISGMGYKRIASVLTDERVPTPRMFEQRYAEEEGRVFKRQVSHVWNVATLYSLIKNDFYIGTLRTGKYMRRGINGIDVRKEDSEHFVFNDNHTPIIDKEIFICAQEINKKRGNGYYRGVKIHPNIYTGFLFCGDCGGPMYSISQPETKRLPAYICGTYHKRGRKGCTSHHILVSTMDMALKRYLVIMRDKAKGILASLDKDVLDRIKKEENQSAYKRLVKELDDSEKELKALTMQRIRQTAKAPGRLDEIDRLYDELESDIQRKIEATNNQLAFIKQSTLGRKNQKEIATTAIQIFDAIIKKDNLSKEDLEMILERATIYEDRIIIDLKADIEGLFSVDDEQGMAKGFTYLQKTPHSPGKRLDINVISEGDPLEIFTDRDGEVILKKYSPIGEISDFAMEYTESLTKTLGHTALISDRDTFIAASGTGKKDYQDKAVSQELEEIMEKRTPFIADRKQGSAPRMMTDIEADSSEYAAQVIVPVIVEGEASGAVVLLTRQPDANFGDTELKVAQAAAGFLGRQMEQ